MPVRKGINPMLRKRTLANRRLRAELMHHATEIVPQIQASARDIGLKGIIVVERCSPPRLTYLYATSTSTALWRQFSAKNSYKSVVVAVPLKATTVAFESNLADHSHTCARSAPHKLTIEPWSRSNLLRSAKLQNMNCTGL